MTKEKWKDLCLSRKAMMYFKPTRFKHESGFRCFEVGYCTLDPKTKRIKDKCVLSISDHIHTDFMGMIEHSRSVNLNMDLTMDGAIRVWGSEKSPIIWEDWPMSSAEIERADIKKS